MWSGQGKEEMEKKGGGERKSGEMSKRREGETVKGKTRIETPSFDQIGRRGVCTTMYDFAPADSSNLNLYVKRYHKLTGLENYNTGELATTTCFVPS